MQIAHTTRHRRLKDLTLLALAWSLFVGAAGCKSSETDSAPLASPAVTPRTTVAATAPAAVTTAPTAVAPKASATTPAAELPSPVETLTYLASDELEGRGVGTKGLDRAADYIVDRFRQIGLEPLPALDGFFQPFSMTTATKIGAGTTLTAAGRSLTLKQTFIPMGFTAPGKFDGPVAFVGYGISSKKHEYDDYAGIDVKGKVALAMRFEPHSSDGKSRFKPESYSDDARLERKASAAAERGAVALLLVTPPEYHGGDDLLPFVGQFMGGTAKIPVVQVRQHVADALLKQGGQPDLATLQKRIDESREPASAVLNGATASGEVVIDRSTSTVKNVAAVLPGSGPRKDEYVIVGAHYDHLGMGGQHSMVRNLQMIHNGADDNASGVTAVLDMAAELARGEPLERSVLFVLFTGEESGLLGSKHFVDHPPVPLEKVAAMLNLDMVGRIRNDTLFVGGGGTAAEFESILKRADDASPLTFKDIGKGGLGPSDHMSFAMKKIPVLFFFSGLHGDYHRPSDDADKINYAGIEQAAEVGVRVVRELAAAPRMAYVSANDGGHYSIGSPTGAGTGSRVTLGVVPDYSSDISTGGAKISGTAPNSPAAAAGLQAGDVIVRFNDRAIDNLYDLSQALADSEPDEVVTLTVKRGEQEVELKAKLAKREG